jgi:hypothetical protein
MRRNLILTTLAVSLLFGTAALADPILYQNVGTENPLSYTFTATASGSITAYFLGSSAGFNDQIGLIDSTANTSNGTLINSQTSVYSQSFNLGNVNQGDLLTFYMIVNNGSTVSTVYSNPALNASYDGTATGTNHVYATTFGASPDYLYIPSGTYIGFEDLPAPISDFDYNDESIVVTDVSITPVPEPGTIALFSIGLFSLAVYGKRRMGKKA